MSNRSTIMKKLFGLILTAALLTTVCTVSAAPEQRGIAQGELARILVKHLGLYRYLPANPSDKDCINLLLINKISPAEGWDRGEIVTRAVLARLIVQSMERQNEVENPEDPMSWINFLKSLGVPLDRVNETVEYVEPLKRMAAPNVFRITPDPISKRPVFGEPDEPDYGADAEFIATIPVDLRDVIEVLRKVVPPPEEPPPLTQD